MMTTLLTAAMVGKMKKQLLIISIIVVIVSIFVSCSVNGSSEEMSTTAVTDSNGTTRYYEMLTDENGSTILAEIETRSDGKAVTEQNGTYVTISLNENATGKTSITTQSSAESTITNNIKNADNVVEFEPADTTKETKPNAITVTKEETTDNPKTTQSATDKDGWVNKWY